VEKYHRRSVRALLFTSVSLGTVSLRSRELFLALLPALLSVVTVVVRIGAVIVVITGVSVAVAAVSVAAVTVVTIAVAAVSVVAVVAIVFVSVATLVVIIVVVVIGRVACASVPAGRRCTNRAGIGGWRWRRRWRGSSGGDREEEAGIDGHVGAPDPSGFALLQEQVHAPGSNAVGAGGTYVVAQDGAGQRLCGSTAALGAQERALDLGQRGQTCITIAVDDGEARVGGQAAEIGELGGLVYVRALAGEDLGAVDLAQLRGGRVHASSVGRRKDDGQGDEACEQVEEAHRC